MPQHVVIDPTAIALLIAGAAAGATMWGTISSWSKSRRDRTVEFLQLQLGEARKEIYKLQGQVELLERAGFNAIHADHQLILQELRGAKG